MVDTDKKSKIQEVVSLFLCYTAACQAQTRFVLDEWRGVWLMHAQGLYKDSTRKEEEKTMFHRIAATVLFVKDVAKCKTFYRDTLGLEVTESDAEHVAVHMDNVYFLLLEVSAAAHMVSSQELELKIDGGPRGLLAAGVEDVDAAYEALKAKGVTFLRPPTDQPWGLRTAYFADPEGNLWEINQPIGS